MVETYAETRNYALLGIVLIIAIIAVGVNSNPVLAQACTAQLGYPQMAAPQYYGSNVQVTVPVSASCSIYTNQLYAVGTAYTGYNSNLGTANAVLTATYSNSFSGQLQFNLPTSVQTVQFSVSIYNAQSGYYQQYYGGQPLAVASETYMVNSNNYQSGYPSYPSNPTYPSYPSYPNYPSSPGCASYPSYGSYSSCSSYPSYPNYPSYPYYPGYYNPNQGSYYYYNGGYYNYYHNGGYHNNYTPHCNNWNSCNHH